MTIEEDINYKGYDLTVKGDLDKGEPQVRYYPDGSGYPGSPASFEATEIYFGKEPILGFLIDTNCTKVIEEIEEEVLRICEEGGE